MWHVLTGLFVEVDGWVSGLAGAGEAEKIWYYFYHRVPVNVTRIIYRITRYKVLVHSLPSVVYLKVITVFLLFSIHSYIRKSVINRTLCGTAEHRSAYDSKLLSSRMGKCVRTNSTAAEPDTVISHEYKIWPNSLWCARNVHYSYYTTTHRDGINKILIVFFGTLYSRIILYIPTYRNERGHFLVINFGFLRRRDVALCEKSNQNEAKIFLVKFISTRYFV